MNDTGHPETVRRKLRAGDKRMDEIVKTVAAIQIEQDSAKLLLAENTETIKEIKTATGLISAYMHLCGFAGWASFWRTICVLPGFERGQHLLRLLDDQSLRTWCVAIRGHKDADRVKNREPIIEYPQQPSTAKRR